ncbi:MAG: serine/threonine protein phosphatase [Helicobacter sp.]|nr:serine/threonine protein phosphatase [Helicobacter sp.]
MQESLYIIGDVHGCFHTLCSLIEKLPQKWDSQIIFTGDLIDRGQKSCEIIDLIIKHNFKSVLGNHEELMLKYYHAIPSDGCEKNWISNGGYETIESYQKNGGLKKIHDHLEWILSLPRYLEISIADDLGQNLFITHGFGIPYYKERDKKAESITWSRIKNHNIKKESQKKYGIFNVFGHDVQTTPMITDNFAAIDTGCVYHKRYKTASLTALQWPSKKLFSQSYCG